MLIKLKVETCKSWCFPCFLFFCDSMETLINMKVIVIFKQPGIVMLEQLKHHGCPAGLCEPVVALYDWELKVSHWIWGIDYYWWEPSNPIWLGILFPSHRSEVVDQILKSYPCFAFLITMNTHVLSPLPSTSHLGMLPVDVDNCKVLFLLSFLRKHIWMSHFSKF